MTGALKRGDAKRWILQKGDQEVSPSLRSFRVQMVTKYATELLKSKMQVIAASTHSQNFCTPPDDPCPCKLELYRETEDKMSLIRHTLGSLLTLRSLLEIRRNTSVNGFTEEQKNQVFCAYLNTEVRDRSGTEL